MITKPKPALVYQFHVYRRDASFHPRSKAGGKSMVYHAPRPGDPALAACSRMIMLLDDPGAGERPIDLDEHQLCSRPACQDLMNASYKPMRKGVR